MSWGCMSGGLGGFSMAAFLIGIGHCLGRVYV